MSSHFRRDRFLIGLLIVGITANFAALSAARSRTYTIPPPTPLPLEFHGWHGVLQPEDPGVRAILPHASSTTVRYEQPSLPATDVVVIASRDPNDMHTPERCLVGSGFQIVGDETRALRVSGPEGGTWTMHRLLIRQGSQEEMLLYGYDGLPALGTSTVMARIAMKLGGANQKPSYFVRFSTSTRGDIPATEARLMAFATEMMRLRHTWQAAAAEK